MNLHEIEVVRVFGHHAVYRCKDLINKRLTQSRRCDEMYCNGPKSVFNVELIEIQILKYE